MTALTNPTKPSITTYSLEYQRALAFIRLTLFSNCHRSHQMKWLNLGIELGTPTQLPPFEGKMQLYEELDLETLEPTGTGPSYELFISHFRANSITLALRYSFHCKSEGIERRQLHQMIYQALKAKPLTKENTTWHLQ